MSSGLGGDSHALSLVGAGGEEVLEAVRDAVEDLQHLPGADVRVEGLGAVNSTELIDSTMILCITLI